MNYEDTRELQIRELARQLIEIADDWLEQLETTDFRVMPLRRVQRHLRTDLKLLKAGGESSA